jgi:hypothetical protein
MKQEEKTIEKAVEALNAIKAQYKVEVIKDYEIPPLVNMRTGATTGFGVELQLNTKYDYDEATLNDWKDKLQADEWHLRVRRSQLWVTFKVRNFVPTEKHIVKMSHAIGLDNKQPKDGCYEAYRNGSFYDEPDELWDDLVVAGYAYDRRKEKDYRYFVTPKGFQLLADHHKLMIRYTNEYEGEK